MKSEKLKWDLHTRAKGYKSYEFWRPGGHYYEWNTNFRREKCMLFGPAEDVFTARYEHVEHTGVGTPVGGPSEPVDPGNSYYSLRFYTQQAKYDRAMILAGGELEEGAGDRIGFIGPGGVDVSTFVAHKG